MRKIIFTLFIFYAVNAHIFSAASEGEWFISNGSGMLIEKALKTRALNGEYAVQVQQPGPEAVPREISKYYSDPWKIECRILYQNARRKRTQWLYRDLDKSTLFIASIGEDGAGFLEWYNEKGAVIEEQRLNSDGSGLFISYTYNDVFLLKAEAHIVEAALPAVVKPAEEAQKKPAEETTKETVEETTKETVEEAEKKPPPEPPAKFIRNPEGPVNIPGFYVAVTGREAGKLWTDNYRYTRTNAVRTIERNYTAASTDEKSRKLTFPRFVPDSKEDREFVAPGNSLSSAFLFDALDSAGARTARSTYTLDSKQRILTETRRDEEDNLVGELTNVWKNDRIEQVTWKADDDERLIQFGYDRNGDRTGERNYRNGILERTVQINNGEEIETLYINNNPVLRAVWRDGIKVSEERVSNIQTRQHETR